MRSKEQHDQRGVMGDCVGAFVQTGLGGRELDDWEALTWSAILHPSPVPQLTQGARLPCHMASYLDLLVECPSEHPEHSCDIETLSSLSFS